MKTEERGRRGRRLTNHTGMARLGPIRERKSFVLELRGTVQIKRSIILDKFRTIVLTSSAPGVRTMVSPETGIFYSHISIRKHISL